MENPSSDGFLSSDEESCSAFRRTRQKTKPIAVDQYKDLVVVNQKEEKVTATTTDTNITIPDPAPQKPRKFTPDTPYPGINPIQMPFSEGDPQPGNLVMSTVGETLHPAVHNWSVDPSYILLGVVTAYAYIKWVSEEEQDQFDN